MPVDSFHFEAGILDGAAKLHPSVFGRVVLQARLATIQRHVEVGDLLTADTEYIAIAAPAITGFSMPRAASGAPLDPGNNIRPLSAPVRP